MKGRIVEELTVRTEKVELPGGRLPHVSRVEIPWYAGETVILEKLVGSSSARSPMEPSNGDRLALSADALSELVELLGELKQ